MCQITFVIETEIKIRPGSGNNEGALDALLAELLADAEEPVDLDDIFGRFAAENYSLEERGAVIVIALAIYERRTGLLKRVKSELILSIATSLLADAMYLAKPCCGNPACHRRAMYLAIQRYNKDFGVPAWIAEVSDRYGFPRKEDNEDLHY